MEGQEAVGAIGASWRRPEEASEVLKSKLRARKEESDFVGAVGGWGGLLLSKSRWRLQRLGGGLVSVEERLE